MTQTHRAPRVTVTSDRPSLHFVCCDTAYCRAPVHDHPTTTEPGDTLCARCVDLALNATCPHCRRTYP